MLVLLMTQLAMALSLGLADGLVGAAFHMRANVTQEPDESTRATKAVELYREQRLQEAAVAFEELWRDFHAPGYLFNAALARERLGHEALAYVLLRRFLAEQIGASERATAERRLQDLQFRAVPVHIELTGARPSDLRFVIQKTPAREAIQVEASLLTLADKPGSYELYVEIGNWTVSASAPSYHAAEAMVEARPGTPVTVRLQLVEEMVSLGMHIEPPEAVSAGVRVRLVPMGKGAPIESRVTASDAKWQVVPGTYTVEVSAPNYLPQTLEIQVGTTFVAPAIVLQPVAPAPVTTAPDRRRLGIGLGATSAVLFAGGVITLGTSLGRYGGRRDDYLLTGASRSYDWVNDVWDLHRNVRGQNVGFVLLGASVGSALGAGLTRAHLHRRVMMAEFGAGALLLVGGTIGFGATRAGLVAQRVQDNEFVDSGKGSFGSDAGSLDRQMLGMGLTGFLAGTGIGLLASGIAELVRARRGESAFSVDVAANFHGGGGGLTISGRF